MISQRSIATNLHQLDRRYCDSKSPKDALYFSKLALLELCGWFEESMDDIVMRCAIRHLKESSNRTYCEEQVVERTWGFDYQKNFRFMLIRLIGLIAVEKIERQVDQAVRSQMVSSLNTLKAERDREAHTHLRGSMRVISAPSVTNGHLAPIFRGLTDFDQAIRRARW